MKHTIHLFMSDTEAEGWNIQVFATPAALLQQQLTYLRQNYDAQDPDPAFARLLATAETERTPATVAAAWTYFEDHLAPHLDGFLVRSLTVDLPNPPPVIVDVRGGVAEAHTVPAGLTLTIRDFDNGAQSDDPDLPKDEDGDPYTEDITEGPFPTH